MAALACAMPCAAAAQAASPDSAAFVRVNQVGYLPDAPKVAVVCALRPVALDAVHAWRTSAAAVVLGPLPARRDGAFGAVRRDVAARLRRAAPSRAIRRARRRHTRRRRCASAPTCTAGSPTRCSCYMRQQRSGYNPFLRDSVHKRDGIIVDHPTRTGEFIPVSGGWADAADYLQYVTTSATATYRHAHGVARRSRARSPTSSTRAGCPAPTAFPTCSTRRATASSGCSRMFPTTATMFNQLGDDRDHTFLDLPTTDSSDYGWGKGSERPVYPCTGKPQGLFTREEPRDGLRVHGGQVRGGVRARRARCSRRATRRSRARCAARRIAAYALGEQYPGRLPDGARRARRTSTRKTTGSTTWSSARPSCTRSRGDARYLRDALGTRAQEPVTPWMGADTARHYQWYPWHNARPLRGRGARRRPRERSASWRATTAQGLERVVGARDQRLPRRHPVHLVLEQPHGRRSRRRRCSTGA